MWKTFPLLLCAMVAAAAPQNTPCDLHWQGERGAELRATFAIRDGQPVIRELAIQKAGGNWTVLARDLTPEFEVVSGKRRVSQQQLNPLQALKVAITPEVIE